MAALVPGASDGATENVRPGPAGTQVVIIHKE